MPTSDETPRALLALSVPGAKMALEKAVINVPLQTRTDVKSLAHRSASRPTCRPGWESTYFVRRLQFHGCVGSVVPSKSTT